MAISSPAGPAQRGIIRLSGPQSWAGALRILKPLIITHAYRWMNAWLTDPPLPAGLILFRAPRSFTGQDMAELHVPGAPALLSMTLEKLLANGARRAEAGEFSARAFLHGKFNLTEVEGIAATISARGRHQLRAAASLRHGRLHQLVQQHADHLADLLALVEAGIDFSDEPDVSFITVAELRERLDTVISAIRALQMRAVSWEALSAQPIVVFLGRANVGKSSLLNSLSGQDRAIVSSTAGTTRDALAVELCDNSRVVRLMDAAGVEDHRTGLAGLMNEARQQLLLRADVILLTIDQEDTPESLAQLLVPVQSVNAWKIIVRNKADLPGGMRATASHNLPWLNVSAKTGDNLAALRTAIFDYAHRQAPLGDDCLTLNARHQQLIQQAGAALQRAGNTLASAPQFPELLAADLRAALDALGAISGAISSDDVLGRIFGGFCIGK
ncbi:MAG: tRNA modification GTPase [Phycisphaerae bacterium]